MVNENQKFEMMNVEQSRRKQFEVFELGGRELLHQGELGLPDCLPATVSPLASSSTYSAPSTLYTFFPRSMHCATAESFDQVPGLFSSLKLTHNQE